MTINEIDLSAVDAVIFDFDGTLYNKHNLPRRLVTGEIGRLGFFARERIARSRMRGKYFGSREAFEEAFFNEMGDGSPFWVDACRKWYEEDYMPLMVRLLRIMYEVEPWVIELVNALHAVGKKVAVYSDYGCVREKMQALNIPLDMADVIVSAPELGGLKPAKESMLKVVEMLGVPAERCLMVGDRDEMDGESARAVGAHFYLISNK